MEIQKLQLAIELHNPEGIREFLTSQPSVEDGFQRKPWIELLIGEYMRSPRFKDCALTFVKSGDRLRDKLLEAVLTDDGELLQKEIAVNPDGILKRYTFSSAYTPLLEVSLLHLCAEFNHVACAEILVSHGLSINTPAGLDSLGFGGQTPIFHTVNQNSNQSKEMLDFCLSHSCQLDLELKGLIWGKDRPWETFIPAVNPISYAMMGLLPQMHRNEKTVAETVSLLVKHRFGLEYQVPNVPNNYLKN